MTDYAMRCRIVFCEQRRLFKDTFSRPVLLWTRNKYPWSPREQNIVFIRVPYCGIWRFYTLNGWPRLKRISGENGHSFYAIQCHLSLHPKSSWTERGDELDV